MRIKTKYNSQILVFVLAAIFANVTACGDSDSTATDAAASADAVSEFDAEMNDSWGATCSTDSDCIQPTQVCTKEPGANEGYCTIRCKNNMDCYDAGAPSQTWSCNAVFSCDVSEQTWCGPKDEVGLGPIIECP